MKLIEPNEREYAVYVSREDFSIFKLLYEEAGYKTVGGNSLDFLKNQYGCFFVDKENKMIGFMEINFLNCEEYGLRELIKLKGMETEE